MNCQEEKSLLQKVGVLVDCSPKFHHKFVGEGIELHGDLLQKKIKGKA
jgi:hypothetical protein